MDTYARTIRKALLLLASCLICWAGALSALEISDVSFPLTRDKADRTLSKDYSYTLLSDGTIRRTWDLGDKKLFIDFDSNTNDAILIAITYDRPVAKKDGIADAHTLAKGNYSEDATWDAPKDSAARKLITDTYGLTNARRKKLNNKAVLFYEANDKGTRITRVSLFSRMPKTNRWELTELRPGGKVTAMGNNWNKEFIEAMYKDEAARQALSLPKTAKPAAEVSVPEFNVGEEDTTSAPTPEPAKPERTTAKPAETSTSSAEPSTSTATASTVTPTTPTASTSAEHPAEVAPTPKPTRPAIGRKTAMGTRANAVGSDQDDTTTIPGTTTLRKKVSEGREGKKELTSTLPPPPNWLEAIGIKNATWMHYIVAGLLVLLILGIIIKCIAKSSAQAARNKTFAQIAGQRVPGQPIQRRRR